MNKKYIISSRFEENTQDIGSETESYFRSATLERWVRKHASARGSNAHRPPSTEACWLTMNFCFVLNICLQSHFRLSVIWGPAFPTPWLTHPRATYQPYLSTCLAENHCLPKASSVNQKAQDKMKNWLLKK